MSERPLIFVNRYFFPDHSATSQLLSDLAFHLSKGGTSVTVITSRQRYQDASANLLARETIGGVEVQRVWSSSFGRSSLIGRSLDYLTFYVSSLLALLRHANGHSILVPLTDPPLIGVMAAIAATVRHSSLVNWIQDLFPEIMRSIGLPVPSPLRWMRDWSLRRASINVAITETIARAVATQGPVIVRQNWADAALAPVPRNENPLRDEWRLRDSFVAGYSGNFGRTHDFATILEAMHALKDDRGIRFLMIGAGAQIASLRAAAPPGVVFQPYQPRESLSASLSAADVHLVSLKPAAEGFAFPSKLYGVLAVARPVIFVGDPNGEVARLLAENECGFAFPPGDAEGVASCIRQLASDHTLREQTGRNGRALYERRFSPAIALAEWERIVRGISS